MNVSLAIWRSVVFHECELGPVEGRIVDAFFAPKEYTDWIASTLGFTHEAPDAEDAHMRMAMFRLLVAHALGGLDHNVTQMKLELRNALAEADYAAQIAALPVTPAPAPAPRPAPGWTWPWAQSAAGTAGVKST